MRRKLAVLCALGVAASLAVPVGSVAAQAPPSFAARGSVEQVSTTGHAPGTPVALLDDDGTEIDAGVADTAGSFLFREVAAGAGYQVRGDAGSVVDGLAVTTPEDHPDEQFYVDQVAADPLEAGYGYLTTRDGTTLSTNVTFPIDGSTGPWPVVVNYSGYSPSAPGPPPQESLIFAAQGYVVVGVNMRGTGCSGGAFDFMEALQSTDGYDVIETMAQQPWSNGDVGMVGISYSGYSQLYVAATQPPHLDAITPLSPYSDTYSGILYPGGILNDGFAVEWATDRENGARPLASGWARTRVDGGDTTCADNQALRLQSKPLLSRIRDTPFADHEFDYLNTETFVDRIEVPTFLSSQWQDEQTGGSAANLIPLFDPDTKVFANFTNGTHVEPMAPSEANEVMVFVDLYVGHRVPRISPLLTAIAPGVLADLFQAGDRDADFALPPSDWDVTGTLEDAISRYETRPRVRLRWENGAIPGQEGLPLAAVTTRHENWPVDGITNAKLYLQPDGALAGAAPTVPDSAARGASAYTYDPSTKRNRTSENGTDSQWAPHPVVQWDTLQEGNSLSFVTEPYAAATAYAGQGSADLWLRSSAADTDLEVTLTEVRPDGQEVFIQSGWLRASHRLEDPARSTELVPYQDHQEADASPLPAGEFSKVRVELFPFAHVIRAGSRLRVNVEAPGGNQPFWAFDALDGTSFNEIGHSAGRPSRVVLPQLPASEAPAVSPTLPACSLAGVTSQSVSLRNQPCRAYTPARTATSVTATSYGETVVVRWNAPAGAAPTTYRVVPSLAAGAPAGAAAPPAITVDGATDEATFSGVAGGTPLEFRVIATYDGVDAPASSASKPVATTWSVLALFRSWDDFVRTQLRDHTGVVRRDWVNDGVRRLTAGLAPQDYLVSIRRGSDARTNVDPIVRFYLAYLGRAPSPQGLFPWVAQRRAGASLATLSQRFHDSAEFRRRTGNLTNEGFVRFAHQATGTTLTSADLQSWTRKLQRRQISRSGLMLELIQRPGYQTRSANDVDAAMATIALLGRAPSATELRATSARLAGGTPLADVLDEILRSPAYARRIGGPTRWPR